MKDVVVIGGPNGAGKTTWAYRNLSRTLDIREFVNADEIVGGLSPLNPDSGAIPAGRVMLGRLNELVEAGESFAFETTCSGLSHGRFLRRCRSLGYRITLIFLWLPTADLAIARVARRVALGGHRIPPEVVMRRYSAGIRNMRDLYLQLADSAFVHDNSDGDGILIAERRGEAALIVHDPTRWKKIESVR